MHPIIFLPMIIENRQLIFTTLLGIFKLNDGAVADPTEVLSVINQQLPATLGGDVRAELYRSGSQGTIQCASDLNCNFEQPCRWSNSGSDHGTVAEMFLARGTPDQGKWQFVMGTSQKPDSPSGFTAAQRNPSESVWFVSDKIPSQPGNGALTLKRWLSPQMHLKVCTRAPGSSTFKYCQKNSEGSIPGPFKYNIPGPIINPFEIVFVIDNFVQDPGGAVAIDDIVYESSLPCSSSGSVPQGSQGTGASSGSSSGRREPSSRRAGEGESSAIQEKLGGDITTSKWTSESDGTTMVRDPSDLHCKSFLSLDCRWRSESSAGADMEWKVGNGQPAMTAFRSHTGTSVRPVDPFLIVYPGAPQSANRESLLISDPIRCQQGDGELSFSYWTSSNSEMRVCTRRSGTTSAIRCSAVIRNGDPGPAFVNIKGLSTPFEIYLTASKLTTENDFVIVDEIEYNAVFC